MELFLMGLIVSIAMLAYAVYFIRKVLKSSANTIYLQIQSLPHSSGTQP